MKYRIYSGNQSKPLAGIHSKSDYIYKYVKHYQKFIDLLSQYFVDDMRIQPYRNWSIMRVSYLNHPTWKGAVYLWKYKKWAPDVTKFELVLPFIPSFIFLYCYGKSNQQGRLQNGNEKMNLNLAGVVVLYHPDASVIQNIQSYLAFIETLYVLDNTEQPKPSIVNQLKMIIKFSTLHFMITKVWLMH